MVLKTTKHSCSAERAGHHPAHRSAQRRLTWRWWSTRCASRAARGPTGSPRTAPGASPPSTARSRWHAACRSPLPATSGPSAEGTRTNSTAATEQAAQAAAPLLQASPSPAQAAAPAPTRATRSTRAPAKKTGFKKSYFFRKVLLMLAWVLDVPSSPPEGRAMPHRHRRSGTRDDKGRPGGHTQLETGLPGRAAGQGAHAQKHTHALSGASAHLPLVLVHSILSKCL